MKKYLIQAIAILTLAASSQELNAQFNKRNMVWGGFQEQFLISTQWKISLDVQTRYDYSTKSPYQDLARVGLTYGKGHFSFTGGGAFFLLFPNPDTKPPRREIRGWEESGYKIAAQKMGIDLRIRMEQRFITPYAGKEIADEYPFNAFRIRLKSEFQYPLFKSDKGSVSAIASEEVLFAFKSFHYSAFDQDRVAAGFLIGQRKGFSAQLSYVLQVQQTSRGKYDLDRIFRIMIIHNLNFIRGGK